MTRSQLTIALLGMTLVACNEVKYPEFEAEFRRDAVLVATCPADSGYASGPTAIRTRVFRFKDELWYEDVDGHRRVDSKVDDVCNKLAIKKVG